MSVALSKRWQEEDMVGAKSCPDTFVGHFTVVGDSDVFRHLINRLHALAPIGRLIDRSVDVEGDATLDPSKNIECEGEVLHTGDAGQEDDTKLPWHLARGNSVRRIEVAGQLNLSRDDRG